MGMEVKVTINPAAAVELATARRRGMTAAGDLILALSDANAPREPEPRHGVHMVETGFRRVELDGAVERVAVGYRAFWAIWQHERLNYHHSVGSAKFLELALLEGQKSAWELVAAAQRAALE